MAKLEKFDIVFDEESAVYFAGQQVSGKVLCSLADPTILKSIKLKVNGSANVEWSEKTNDGYRTYSNSEQYFVYRTTLFGHDSLELNAGLHSFEFSTVLPMDLPSCFEGHHGHVRYYVKATAELQQLKSEVVCQKLFSVNTVADLNQIKGASTKMEKEKSKLVCCLCCESGPIQARCWLPHQGVVPGEAVSFSAEIVNKSNTRGIKSNIRLVQSIIYHASAKQRTVDTVIYEAHRPAFRTNEDYWSDFKILVPPLPPSPFNGCKIMTIDYWIQFAVDPGLFSVNLKLRLPLTIGTIPLKENFSQFEVANGLPRLSLPPLSDDCGTLASPSFGKYNFEASHVPESGDESGKEDQSYVIGFQPRYVLYRSVEGN